MTAPALVYTARRSSSRNSSTRYTVHAADCTARGGQARPLPIRGLTAADVRRKVHIGIISPCARCAPDLTPLLAEPDPITRQDVELWREDAAESLARPAPTALADYATRLLTGERDVKIGALADALLACADAADAASAYFILEGT